MKIKLCKKYAKKKKLAKQLLLTYPNATIEIKSCIGICKHCKERPTAVIDSQKFKSKTIKKFITALSA
ncbi:MAG: hypothetical protein K0U47_02470 [Epsilonproteobacteria bacterium]|nr:hypothetical protein [Campylobacterota bacterium]